FRLTRNQDLDLDDDTQDLLESLEEELHKRRFGPAVRLEVDEEIDPELLKTLAYELEIPEEEVIKYKEPLDLTALYQIADLKIPALKYPPYKSFIPKPFKDAQEGKRDIFQVLKERELGLHHPYDTFSSSVV
ncbi:MAG: RNA degradosome polyphosphate kinase, partial [Actinomycetes bacterium]